MNRIGSLSVLLGLWCSSMGAQAEGNCPSGFYPIGGSNAGWTGCAPIPGAQEEQQAPRAPASIWADRWGAIATDKSLSVLGVSTGMASDRAAKQASLDDCKAQGGMMCKFEKSYVNSCTAVTSSTTDYFVGVNPSLGKVVLDGLQNCNAAILKNCHTVYSACSLSVRIQ